MPELFEKSKGSAEKKFVSGTGTMVLNPFWRRNPMSFAPVQIPAMKAESLPVLGFWKDGDSLVPTQAATEAWSSSLIESLRSSGLFPSQKGEMLTVPPCADWPKGLVLLHLGSRVERTPEGMGALVRATVAKLRKVPSLLFRTTDWFGDDREVGARLFAQNVVRALAPKVNYKKDAEVPQCPEVLWLSDTDESQALAEGAAIGAAIAEMCRLADTPANLCTPAFLCEEARHIAKNHEKISATILEKPALEALGMGGLLGVARGSTVPPAMIELRYDGASCGESPVVLVGKGITFDAGGISLKPAAKMGDMIYDMSGAASVLAVVQAVADLALPINLVAIAPACENLPSGTALKPGDILTTYSGRTVEVQNTDAEGRLILADGLTKALEHKPQLIIDVATLTGACVVALGSTYTGLFSNRDDLADKLLEAGKKTGDLAWRMPLHSDYTELMQSSYADLVNVSAVRGAGASTAAAFLETFVEGTPWAHLDIAGTANTSGKDHASTGRPVALLVEFLRAFAESKKDAETASV